MKFYNFVRINTGEKFNVQMKIGTGSVADGFFQNVTNISEACNH